MLLLLGLPCRQPFVKLLLTDDLQHSVHLVVTEPAKLGTENFIISGLYGREMHVDREARHGVLLKAHGRNKEAVDDVVGARSEEHTSELQSLRHLVCRLLLEKKKKNIIVRETLI